VSIRVHPWLKLALWGLPLAWLWFRLVDHLRVEWAVNPQYAYGWAVPFLCLYLLWRNAEKLKAEMLKSSEGQAESRKQKAEEGPRDYETTRPRTTDYGTMHYKTTDHGPRTTDYASRTTPHSSPFSFSAFQLFSVSLLAFLYLPTRLIQEANPEWRLVSWALALEVIGITLLLLRSTEDGGWGTEGGGGKAETLKAEMLKSEGRRTEGGGRGTEGGGRKTEDGGRGTEGGARFTLHASRFTFPLLFFLVAVPWPTFIEGPLVQGLMRANVGVTTELLGALGVPAAPHGNVIEVATGMVGVDDACSGIRSFQATLMISLFFGELYGLTAMRRVLCVLADFSLSFLFNVARTTLLTWVAAHKGTAAIASWHDPAGVTILVACFLCLWLIARGLRGKAEMLKAEMLKSGGRKTEGEKLKC